MGCDSIIGTVTQYRLNGPGAHPASYKMGTGSFPGLSNWGMVLSTEVKERIELYIYSPCGPSWPILGLTVPVPWTMVYNPNSF